MKTHKLCFRVVEWDRDSFQRGENSDPLKYCILLLLLYIYYMKKRMLYNRIAVLREERGLSRKDLSEAVGVNYQTVGYLERFEYTPSLDLAFRICEFFDLPVEMVFSTEPMKPLSEELLRQRRGERGSDVG